MAKWLFLFTYFGFNILVIELDNRKAERAEELYYQDDSTQVFGALLTSTARAKALRKVCCLVLSHQLSVWDQVVSHPHLCLISPSAFPLQ